MLREERLNSLDTAIFGALSGNQAGIWTALPGIIESVDFAHQTVVVQPAIQGQQMLPDNSYVWVTLPLCLDVPIVWQGGGGFTATFPIAPGDECLLVFTSKCFDSWWQSGGIQVQAELRMHDLSDGMAIVGLRSQPRLPSAPASNTAAEIRSDDGLTKVQVGPGSLVRLQAAVVEVHATTEYRWDINGYGVRTRYLGSNVWQNDNYTTPRTTSTPPDTVNNVAHDINPPEIP